MASLQSINNQKLKQSGSMIIHSFNQNCLVVKMLHYYSWEMENHTKLAKVMCVCVFFVQTLQSFQKMWCYFLNIYSQQQKQKMQRIKVKFVPGMFTKWKEKTGESVNGLGSIPITSTCLTTIITTMVVLTVILITTTITTTVMPHIQILGKA